MSWGELMGTKKGDKQNKYIYLPKVGGEPVILHIIDTEIETPDTAPNTKFDQWIVNKTKDPETGRTVIKEFRVAFKLANGQQVTCTAKGVLVGMDILGYTRERIQQKGGVKVKISHPGRKVNPERPWIVEPVTSPAPPKEEAEIKEAPPLQTSQPKSETPGQQPTILEKQPATKEEIFEDAAPYTEEGYVEDTGSW